MNMVTETKIRVAASEKQGKLFTVRTLTVVAMLSAVAALLMLFEIPLWFAPFFYELDFSEVPVMVGAFALGPMAGVLIELVKVLLNLIFNGTITMGVGELANFLIGCSLVVPAAFIYHRRKSFQSALTGMIVGTVSMTILGSVLNAVLLLPVFAFFNNTTMAELISIGTGVNPAIKNLTTFIVLAVVPFNLLKGVVASVITMGLYKQISTVIKSFTR